jgi:hypothetical protein
MYIYTIYEVFNGKNITLGYVVNIGRETLAETHKRAQEKLKEYQKDRHDPECIKMKRRLSPGI